MPSSIPSSAGLSWSAREESEKADSCPGCSGSTLSSITKDMALGLSESISRFVSDMSHGCLRPSRTAPLRSCQVLVVVLSARMQGYVLHMSVDPTKTPAEGKECDRSARDRWEIMDVSFTWATPIWFLGGWARDRCLRERVTWGRAFQRSYGTALSCATRAPFICNPLVSD